jgi:hypothetical protein
MLGQMPLSAVDLTLLRPKLYVQVSLKVVQLPNASQHVWEYATYATREQNERWQIECSAWALKSGVRLHVTLLCGSSDLSNRTCSANVMLQKRTSNVENRQNADHKAPGGPWH